MVFFSVLVILITIFVFKYEYQIDLTAEFKSVFIDQINQNYEGQIENENGFTIAVNIFMITVNFLFYEKIRIIDKKKIYFFKFQCCGINDYTDFNNATKWNRTTSNGLEMVSPLACCKFDKTQINAAIAGKIPSIMNDTCVTSPTSENSNFMKVFISFRISDSASALAIIFFKGCFTQMNPYLSKLTTAILTITFILGLFLVRTFLYPASFCSYHT
jgi:hypothetical protein